KEAANLFRAAWHEIAYRPNQLAVINLSRPSLHGLLPFFHVSATSDHLEWQFLELKSHRVYGHLHFEEVFPRRNRSRVRFSRICLERILKVNFPDTLLSDEFFAIDIF